MTRKALVLWWRLLFVSDPKERLKIRRKTGQEFKVVKPKVKKETK